MPRRRQSETETLQVPYEDMAFADARIAAIVRRACQDQNVVESVARSCYLQGLWDGARLVIDRPELLTEIGDRIGDSDLKSTEMLSK